MRSREVIQLIEADGWYEVEVKGRVTVPHPNSDLPKGTVHSIMKQAGLKQCSGFDSSNSSGDAR
ncbi:TPA: type II toxin-antitoxin system HicA family toxin [Pseudomonas putida]|uniref:type II toxin-antitoxin system HicA family toxin n=1 Tax=Pseudomonas sp. TaxID=306 RepID=UPI0028A8F765|nr:type II toxin-antitoxin system HicA family toxin [Pseudomonas sp.]